MTTDTPQPTEAELPDMRGRAVESFISSDGNMTQFHVLCDCTVNKILYHWPLGDGDRHFCDVYTNLGKVERWFAIGSIVFAAEGPKP